MSDSSKDYSGLFPINRVDNNIHYTAREYGLSDHALTNSLDMRSPILQEEFMRESRTVDEKAGHVRKSMIRGL